jgi:drug/metabolite transporter (DMT)-like permease
MSYFVLGEIIMPGQVIGGVLTIAGLVVMRRGRESRRTPEADRH